MPIGFLAFIAYLIIIVFNRLQKQAKKSSNSMKKEEDSLNSYESSFIPDKTKYAKNTNDIEETNDTEKKEIILVDDEVEGFYNKREIKKPIVKLPDEDKEKQSSTKEEILQPYFYDNPLINGIIFSELIGLPRALRPYKSGRYNRIGE